MTARVTGPGGGAASSSLRRSQFPVHLKALTRAGKSPTAHAPVACTSPRHVGMILVERPKACHGRQGFYVAGRFYTSASPREAADLRHAEGDEKTRHTASTVHCATDDNALKANVGERGRLYVATRPTVSSFPFIGEIFDKVWYEGGKRIRKRADHAGAGGRRDDRDSISKCGQYGREQATSVRSTGRSAFERDDRKTSPSFRKESTPLSGGRLRALHRPSCSVSTRRYPSVRRTGGGGQACMRAPVRSATGQRPRSAGSSDAARSRLSWAHTRSGRHRAQ